MLRRMVDAPVPGNRRRRRQKTRWKDSCERDMERAGQKVKDVMDRTKHLGNLQLPKKSL